MPDITMCSNKNCPLRKRCYRYMAIPNPHYQSYSCFKLEYLGGPLGAFTCEHFVKVNRKTDKLQENMS